MTGDELVHGWKEERMNGRMVPRRIMVFVGTWLLWRWLLRSYLEPGYTEHNHFVVFNIGDKPKKNFFIAFFMLYIALSTMLMITLWLFSVSYNVILDPLGSHSWFLFRDFLWLFHDFPEISWYEIFSVITMRLVSFFWKLVRF